MEPPSYFTSDARRNELVWNDWDEVVAFLRSQTVCRIAVNDGPWPYVVGQRFRFVDGAFALHFSRSGRLAAALERDPRCTIEIDETVRIREASRTSAASADYRSVIARCSASLSTVDLESFGPEPRQPRRILAVRATVVSLSAKKRVLAEAAGGDDV